MKLKNLTKVFLVGIMLIILFFDLWLVIFGGVESTISYIIYQWSFSYPLFTFLFGVICGHLFGQIKEP